MPQDPNKDKDQLLDWARGLVEDGRMKRRASEAQWWENIATFGGDLWVEFDVHKMRLVEPNKADHRARLPINLAQPAVRTEYAKLLKNRPMVNCVARSADRKDINSAEVGDKMLNNYGEQRFHKAKVRRRALWWVLVCGYGGIFVDWDPKALGEIEVVVDAHGDPIFDPLALKKVQEYYRDKQHRVPKTKSIPQGDLVIKHFSPFQLIYDFSQLFLEDAAWAIYTDVVDVNYAYNRWGVELEPNKFVEPGVIERRMLQRVDLSNQLELKPPTNQDLVEVHRLFIKPGHRYFPLGAEVVFTEEEFIDATEFPHNHGELPFGAMGHIPFQIHQHPQSILQQIKPVVLEISKTESQMLDNRNLMSNPPWIEWRQNRIQGEIQNKPGMRLKIDYVPGAPEPHPVQMPDLPDYVKILPELLGQHILEISGQNETSQGQVPAGARSGVAIAYLTEENDTKLGPTVQEYEEMIEHVSWLELQAYAQYYELPRTIRLTGKGTEPEVFDFVGSELAGVDRVQVQAGSALPRSLAAKQQYTLDLYDRGLIRNPRQVLEMLDVGQGEQDEWEKDMDQAERENRRMQAGKRQPVLEWYNHPAHLFVHHSYMKSADFEELDPAYQQIYIEHEEEHQNMVAEQQQSQMRQQEMAGAGGQGGEVAPGQGQNQPAPSGQFSSPDDMAAVSGSNGSGNQQDYQPQ